MKTAITLLFCLLAAVACAGSPLISYNLAMPEPQTHLFRITMELTDLPGDSTTTLILPVWRPGRYSILDFSSGIQEFSARAGNHLLKWHRSDKSSWTIESGGQHALTVSYSVYANDFNIRTRGLNDRHAFVDESSVFMYVEKFRSLPVRLKVEPFRGWHVTTGLDREKENLYSAPGYDYFIDCPLEIGTQKDIEFEVDGVTHVLSMAGEGSWNADTLVRDISAIVRAEKEFWGTFPYRRYYFLVECTPGGGGGTEHLNSTIIQVPPGCFTDRESYQDYFLATVAHEFFHTWNVKQLRPAGIHPFDFTRENYSRELWIAEGTTTYYANIMLARAGFLPAKKFFDIITSTVASDRARPGNRIESVADASFNSWTESKRSYQQTYNAGSDIYERGAMISTFLDLTIRRETGGRYSLDDLMRTMYNRFPLSGKGYTLDDLRSTLRDLTGWDCTRFFDDYIYGTAQIPWEEALDGAGLRLVCTDSLPKPWLGITTYENSGTLRIGSIVAGSPAYTSGLDLGDVLLALDDARITNGNLTEQIGTHKPGDSVRLAVFHDDRLRTITVVLGAAPKLDYKLVRTEHPTDLQKALFTGWLHTAWSDSAK